MTARHIIFSLLVMSVAAAPYIACLAADGIPTINPTAIFITDDGEEEGTSYSGSAPLEVHFYANAEDTAGWTEYYEWRFTYESETEPYLIRYEEDTSYTFTTAGSTRVVLYARFSCDGETVEYTDDYWATETPLIISISESKLDFPNAFSPNDDGINDIYKAKEGYQSIVEFKATIYNRYGQKLYEWTDPAGGWDGTYHGKNVAQGTYYVHVSARGADGRKYNIKRDVNLLRGYSEDDE